MIAVVPYLLGFHPADSLVIVAVAGPHAKVRLAFRYDLPDPPDRSLTAQVAEHAAWVLHRENLTAIAVIGYGPSTLVTPVTDVLRQALPRAGIRLVDVLRVQDGRYWSCLCTEPACCPAEGRPLGTDDQAAAALARYGPAPLASRAGIAAAIAPVTGADARAMARATRRTARAIAADLDAISQDAVFAGLRRAVQDAITLYRAGGTITDAADLAGLTLALDSLEVRDDAWARMQPEHRAAHLQLWTDLTRWAAPGYVAAPASLLAFTAWQDSQPALASLALDRALADTPGYSMAQLLRDALAAGLPPSAAVPSMTPEQVAASYDLPDGVPEQTGGRVKTGRGRKSSRKQPSR